MEGGEEEGGGLRGRGGEDELKYSVIWVLVVSFTY